MHRGITNNKTATFRAAQRKRELYVRKIAGKDVTCETIKTLKIKMKLK